VVDPVGRELTISCGAALYNLRIAAEYFGHEYRVEVFPNIENPKLLARFHLGLTCQTSSEDVLLFHAIQERRTNRSAFRPDPLPPALLEMLEADARSEGVWLHLETRDECRVALADLVAEADRIQWADQAFRNELTFWLRTRLDQHRDGIPAHDLGIKDWMSFAASTLIRRFNLGSGEAAKDHEIAIHSPAMVVLGTKSDGPDDWLRVGQALQKVLLRAQSEGVSGSFLNQPIEVPDLRNRVAETIGREEPPQLLLRLGYGPSVPPVPRRSVRDALLHHEGGHAR
jgi:hypothetical protein